MTTTSNNIQVRPFQESDGPAVTQIWVEGLQQTSDNLWRIVRPLVSNAFAKDAEHTTGKEGDLGPNGKNIPMKWMNKPDRTFLVATTSNEDSKEEEVVGCVGVIKSRTIGHQVVSEIEQEFSNESLASVWRVSVSEKHRRRGIGSKLMQAAEDWAQQNNCHTVWLNSINPRALDFYRSIGYDKYDWTGLRLFKKVTDENVVGKEEG